MQPTTIAYPATTLAVLHTCDAVVVGGSFGAVAVAVELARAGHTVTLIETRTYLGWEITATLRPWIQTTESAPLPEHIASTLRAAGKELRPGYYALNLDALKLHLEDTLLVAGVKILYASLVVGVQAQDNSLTGVVIGNKAGRQVIRCRLLIDTSETALLARLTRTPFEARANGQELFRRTLEFDNVAPGLDYNRPLTIGGQQVRLHPGYREKGHVLVECEHTLPAASDSGFSLTQRETEARHQSMALAAQLMARVPAFGSAYLSAASYELCGSHAPRMDWQADAPEWTRTFTDAALPVENESIPAHAFAGSVRGLWHLNEAVPITGLPQKQFTDPVFTSRVGHALGHWLCNHWTAACAPPPTDTASPAAEPSPRASDLQIREPVSPQRGYPFERTPAPGQPLPVLYQATVLVVGGGSSGAIAAITAAREGARTVLLEMNPGLGGTGTFGGVHSYWFGRRVGYAGQVTQLVANMHRYLHHPEPKGVIPKWNIEAKSYALLKAADDLGVKTLCNSLVIGALVEANRVAGVVVATRTGPAIIRAQVVIDASGDGDVAAFAGAEYVYGNTRDHVVMWYALAQFARPGLTRNHFTSMVDVSNIEDYTRAVLAGRRRGREGDMHDHGVYIAPRESRHIRGDCVLTLTDQLRHRCWDDVINITFSNHDVKGHTGSDWLRIGLIPPNLEIEIPFRALLPHRLENILVVGKAFSATHDALPAIRMQADLENLGGVAAIAAAIAARERRSLRQIDVKYLQARLVDEAVLPPQVLTRTLAENRYSDSELQHMIDTLPTDPLYTYSDMELTDLFTNRIPLVEICSSGPRVIPLLEQALIHADGPRKVRLAQALALVGSNMGVPALIEAISSHLQDDRLPARTAHIRYTQLPPDHGAMPDVVYLLYSMGLVPDARALPVWRRVVELLAHVTEADFYEEFNGTFYYVDAVCFAAERLATDDLIASLKALHAHPAFHNRVSAAAFEPDYILERLAYLELVIGRALARCGSIDGLVILMSYLRDNRALLAEHAHDELVTITGADHGKDTQAWSQWLEANADSIRPQPWIQATDAIQAWSE